MAVSVVVGGQFGSEGKGKVALEIARRNKATFVVRVGGTNSGHTAVDSEGNPRALRQLPASVFAPSAVAVLPPGALIDPEIFEREVRELGLGPDRVIVSPFATVISSADKDRERDTGLVAQIGSTGSGTGAALQRRIGRQSNEAILARELPSLRPFLANTSEIMRAALDRNERIVIEGTQGFGLSVLHGGYYPKATSRDTTAAAFVAEAGLSSLDVDDVTLVIRAHPIRVAGDSGPLPNETTWDEIAAVAGLPKGYCELTTATKRVRRVGAFHPDLVIRAIAANAPSRIVLNHFDYVDIGARQRRFSAKVVAFLEHIELSIGRKIAWIGIGPGDFIDRSEVRASTSARLEVAIPA